MNRLPTLFAALVLLLAAPALAANPFDVNAKSPEWAIVTATEFLQDSSPTSPMLDQLRGILARLDKSQVTELRATGAGPLIQTPAELKRLCIIHVGQGPQIKHVEVLRDPAGLYYAQELLPQGADPPKNKPRATKLVQARFAKLSAGWPHYHGDFKPQDTPKPGQVAPLTRPYTPGWFIIDNDMLSERINGGMPTNLQVPPRDLNVEPLCIRLPKNYDPKTSYGVLVYIDPGENGSIYQPFHPAADELGFIMVAAVHTGNKVDRSIRYQLALDGLATVAERYLIDPRHIYVTGISGGGQISTHLWLCFPEVFSAAVPIVALASYQNIPAGPGQIWPATLKKPQTRFFKQALTHRCAAITGAQDMNEKIINDAANLLIKDGFNVKVYDYPDMGHQAPTAERFLDALKWVDEPYREMRDKEVKAAEETLAKALATGPLSSEARKVLLVEATKAGPWTPAAWHAAELLEVKPPSEP
jgi:predicted esterase